MWRIVANLHTLYETHDSLTKYACACEDKSFISIAVPFKFVQLISLIIQYRVLVSKNILSAIYKWIKNIFNNIANQNLISIFKLKINLIVEEDKNKDASFWDDSSVKSSSPRDQR